MLKAEYSFTRVKHLRHKHITRPRCCISRSILTFRHKRKESLMYAVKPIIDSSRPLDGVLARTMYNMPSSGCAKIAGTTPTKAAAQQGSVSGHHVHPKLTLETITDQISKVQKSTSTNDAAVAALEARQAKVLRQLEDLKNKLDCMKSVLRAPQLSAPKDALHVRLTPGPTGEPYFVMQEMHRLKYGCATKPVPAAHLADIVINANPAKYIPYSLRIVKTLWQDRVHVHVQTFTHSSIGKLPAAAQQFNETIAYTRPNSSESTVVPTLNVTLIWKQCDHPELICSAAQYQPLVGEANILRYLYRSGPAELQWPDHPVDELFVPDRTLDLAHALTVVAADAKQRQPVWQQLAQLLHESRHFGGGLMCAGDVAVASAVRQFGVLGNDKVPATLLAMWTRVLELAEYRAPK